MDITVQKINKSIITLDFIQDLDEGVDDITPLYNSLKKIKNIINKPGYNNKFNKEERLLWNYIFEEVLEKEDVSGIQSAGNNLIHT